MLIDTHSHIHFHEKFPDALEVFKNAQENGVGKQIIVGCNLEDSKNALKFVQDKDGLFATIGIHPHDSAECDDQSLNVFEAMLRGEGEWSVMKKRPVAIGEIGLDYFKNYQAVDVQQKAFRLQLQLAKRHDLPVIVHVRDAFEDAFKILEEEGNTKVLLHCFSGGMLEAEQAWARGYVTSFSGVITYPKNVELQKVVEKAPENLYVVETDCPFLAPQSKRGQRNEPAFVVETAKEIARLKRLAFDGIAETTTRNAERFFSV